MAKSQPGRAPKRDQGVLDALLSDIRACRICRDTPAGKPLAHEPRPVLRVTGTARICICGQAPGTKVHASGKPFTDPSGVRLRDWMGVSEAEFYDKAVIAIIPMGFCFPGLNEKGADLPPRRECARNWREPLFAALHKFELVLLVGRYAQVWHLGKAAAPTLTATVQDWVTHFGRRGATRTLPLPHPSWRNNGWIKKNQWFETDLLPVLKRDVRRILG